VLHQCDPDRDHPGQVPDLQPRARRRDHSRPAAGRRDLPAGVLRRRVHDPVPAGRLRGQRLPVHAQRVHRQRHDHRGPVPQHVRHGQVARRERVGADRDGRLHVPGRHPARVRAVDPDRDLQVAHRLRGLHAAGTPRRGQVPPRRAADPDRRMSRKEVLYGRHADQGAHRRAGDLPGHLHPEQRRVRHAEQLAGRDEQQGVQGPGGRHQGPQLRQTGEPRPRQVGLRPMLHSCYLLHGG